MTPRALKKWRQSTGRSQEQFANWLGVSRSTVNRWEGGLAPVPHMVRLLETLEGFQEALLSTQHQLRDAQDELRALEEDEGIGHARLTGQENYDHENQHQPPLENPMDWEK